MSTPIRRSRARALRCSSSVVALAILPRAGAAPLVSDIPQAFTPRDASFDYVKREVMMPMRDGVKLYTLLH